MQHASAVLNSCVGVEGMCAGWLAISYLATLSTGTKNAVVRMNAPMGAVSSAEWLVSPRYTHPSNQNFRRILVDVSFFFSPPFRFSTYPSPTWKLQRE